MKKVYVNGDSAVEPTPKQELEISTVTDTKNLRKKNIE